MRTSSPKQLHLQAFAGEVTRRGSKSRQQRGLLQKSPSIPCPSNGRVGVGKVSWSRPRRVANAIALLESQQSVSPKRFKLSRGNQKLFGDVELKDLLGANVEEVELGAAGRLQPLLRSAAGDDSLHHFEPSVTNLIELEWASESIAVLQVEREGCLHWRQLSMGSPRAIRQAVLLVPPEGGALGRGGSVAVARVDPAGPLFAAAHLSQAGDDWRAQRFAIFTLGQVGATSQGADVWKCLTGRRISKPGRNGGRGGCLGRAGVPVFERRCPAVCYDGCRFCPLWDTSPWAPGHCPHHEASVRLRIYGHTNKVATVCCQMLCYAAGFGRETGDGQWTVSIMESTVYKGTIGFDSHVPRRLHTVHSGPHCSVFVDPLNLLMDEALSSFSRRDSGDWV